MPLSELQFADTNAVRIEAAVISGFEAAARAAGQSDFRLYPGDPRRLFLEAVALIILQQNALIDKTGKSNLLRFAGEDSIEDIGYLYGSRGARLQASAALTTIEFTLSIERPTITTIPAGTRVTTGNLIFLTIENLDIPANTLTGTVVARCEVTGITGNGLLPGQIVTLVDRPPFVESVRNITETAGGADIEGLEAYRARLRMVPESFSVAGPDGAYEFWTKTASPAIVSVDVWMPTPGHVNVVPLMEGGLIPQQEVLDAINEILNDRTIRPLTDFVHILAPKIVEYDLKMTYWIDIANATRATEIQSAVNAAVLEYTNWQHGTLGLDIIPDMLTKKVMKAGARRLQIDSPVFTEVERGYVPRQRSTEIIYGGLENA